MVNLTTKEKVNYVQKYSNVTDMVYLMKEYDLFNSYDIECNGHFWPILQWWEFLHFTESDYQKLIQAGIPVWQNEQWPYVGISGLRPAIEHVAFPQIYHALFKGRAK